MSEQAATVDGLMALVEQFGAYRWGTGVAEESRRVVLAANEDERAVGVRDAIRAYAERLAASPAVQAVPTWDAMPPAIEGRLSLWLTLGKELNPHTVNLVVRFARALAAKLADAEVKYGYSDGWRSPDRMDECRAKLLEHIAKGDPRDVAAYCAFLWHHGERTTLPAAPIQRPGDHLQGCAS
jgi:hypothetical protein